MAKFSLSFLAVFLGLLNISVILACNCQVKHPQTQYKESKFVVKAKVLDKHADQEGPESSFRPISYLEYQVKVLKIFKGRKNIDSTVVSMFTPDSNSCGLHSMKPGKNYLISGYYEDGALQLSVCSWVEKWSELTKEQKIGLKSAYATKCKKCNVPSVSGPELVMALNDPQDLQVPPRKLYSLSGLWANEPGSCTFNPVDSWQFPTMDCETLYTYCSKDTEEQCSWLINNKYKDCFIDRETAWAKREVRKSTLQARTGMMRIGALGTRRFLCLPSAPEEEFHACMRREVAAIVTQFLN